MTSTIERKKDQHLCEISKQHQEKSQDMKSLWEEPTWQTSWGLASSFSAAAAGTRRAQKEASKLPGKIIPCTDFYTQPNYQLSRTVE